MVRLAVVVVVVGTSSWVHSVMLLGLSLVGSIAVIVGVGRVLHGVLAKHVLLLVGLWGTILGIHRWLLVVGKVFGGILLRGWRGLLLGTLGRLRGLRGEGNQLRGGYIFLRGVGCLRCLLLRLFLTLLLACLEGLDTVKSLLLLLFLARAFARRGL